MAVSPSFLVISAINHVLMHETWARQRLAPFANQSAKIEANPFQILFSIAPDGLLETTADAGLVPAVCIILPGDSLGKLIYGDTSSIFSAARISGSADLSEALAFVFRNIEWNYESDLAALIGDIPATRVISSLKQFADFQRSAFLNVANNFKEYLTEESHQVISSQEISTFGCDVNVLRDDLERLEKRISRLK